MFGGHLGLLVQAVDPLMPHVRTVVRSISWPAHWTLVNISGGTSISQFLFGLRRIPTESFLVSFFQPLIANLFHSCLRLAFSQPPWFCSKGLRAFFPKCEPPPPLAFRLPSPGQNPFATKKQSSCFVQFSLRLLPHWRIHARHCSTHVCGRSSLWRALPSWFRVHLKHRPPASAIGEDG